MAKRIFLKIFLPSIVSGFFLIAVFILLSYQKLTIIEFFLILSLILLFLFSFSFGIGQKFVIPIKKLINAIQELNKGKLKTRIYLETKDEFEDISIFLNQIAEELERSQVIVEQTKKSVDLKVRARTKELEDSIKTLESKVKVRAMELQKQIAEFEKLQQLAAAREKELIELKKEIKKPKEKKLKTEFVALAAHQLRTPLAGIKWNLKMMLDGSFGKISNEQKEFLSKTYQNNERMIKLVSDLLDVSKIEEGRYLHYEKKDIIKITEELIESLNEKIKEKKLQFKFNKPKEEIPEIELDREKIAICLQNLLINAITYTNSGGKVTVSLKYDKKKKEIIFLVKDTGIGIPKAQQKRIFTKFYRTSLAIKNETMGTGLGLYITKNIIEDHKGKIWFESEEGKGSTFYFSLPTKE